MTARLYCGNALDVLAELPEQSIRCCVTSPPYWGLRDYGTDGQIGLEKTPEEYTETLVAVFREVRRVLTQDGTLWLNLGDTYCSMGGAGGTMSASGLVGGNKRQVERPEARDPEKFGRWNRGWGDLKPKDLVGIPWRVAFALQSDGWYLRSDIIWAKPNPMPESVTDRPTKAHEYVFLLSKSARYYYDGAVIKTAAKTSNWADKVPSGWDTGPGNHDSLQGRYPNNLDMTKAKQQGKDANARTVWTIATAPYPEAHFATFPPELAKRCILAGSTPGDTVLDPFGGSGTTAAVATGNGRQAIYIDLNPDYLELAEQRIGPMLCEELVSNQRTWHQTEATET